ncbi:MAG TPA: hypothetical protein VIH49_03500 [Solirubrobacteraceae bacterium]
MSTVRWQRDVPESIRLLGALEGADYEDVVTSAMQELPDMTPEQLVRATLTRLPRGLLLVVPLIQRVVLGLRLELRPSPDHVLGWKIAERAENWIRIEAASWFLTGHVVMHAEDGCLSFATFVRYERRPAALVWAPVSLIHRQVALALVRSATKVGGSGRSGSTARSG